MSASPRPKRKRRPKPAANQPGTLPVLPVEICSASGELLRTIELADPREAFCAAYNRLPGDDYARLPMHGATKEGGEA